MSPSGTTAPGTTLPAEVGHDRTARRILEHAAQLFGTRGVHGTSMREIATAAGIRAPSIYEHFSSKEVLVGELMTIGRDTTIDHFDRAVRAVSDDPIERLDAAVDALVSIHTTYPMLMRVLTDDVHGLSPEVTAPALTMRLEMSLRLGQILVEGEQQGLLSYPNLVSTVAAVHGLLIRIPYWFTPGDDYGVAELTADYRELVASMLRVD
jgi:AcrR family transcriptional regulator